MKAEGMQLQGWKATIHRDIRHHHSKSDNTYLLVWKLLFRSSFLFNFHSSNFERYRSILIFVRRQFFNASANELCELFQRGAGSASHSTHIRKTKVRP